jgi:hypothetical protein
VELFLEFLHDMDGRIIAWCQNAVHALERKDWAEREELIGLFSFLAWFPLAGLGFYVCADTSHLVTFAGMVIVSYYAFELMSIKNTLTFEKTSNRPYTWIEPRFLRRMLSFATTLSLASGFLFVVALIAWHQKGWDKAALVIFLLAGPVLVTVLEYILCTMTLPPWKRPVKANQQGA